MKNLIIVCAAAVYDGVRKALRDLHLCPDVRNFRYLFPKSKNVGVSGQD
jgi:hypothetical protein